MSRIRTKSTRWALGVGAALCLAACSGTDPATDLSSAPATAASRAPVQTDTPTAREPTPSAAASTDVSAAALCEYLTGQLPVLRAIGSKVGAGANLTANLFGWYDNQGAVPDGTRLDEQTKQECPDVGAEVLGLAGVASFTAL